MTTAYFETLLERISLNKSRLSRIEKALNNFDSFLRNDDPIRNSVVDSFGHGSFKHGTAIKPTNGGEYDVDTTLVMDLSKLNIKDKSPSSVVQWIAVRLRTYYDSLQYLESRPRIEQRKRCVRVDYAGDFHLDIVPAYYQRRLFGKLDDSYLYIPDRSDGRWIKNNPRGYNNWIAGKTREIGGVFSKVVKILKHWRNLKFSPDRAPKSILLETLIGNNVDGSQDIEQLLLRVTRGIKSDLFGAPALMWPVYNPSMRSEDLSSGWNWSDISLFKKRIASFIEHGEKAINAGSESNAIREWDQLLTP